MDLAPTRGRTTPTPEGGLAGWGVREGKAMIATLRHCVICAPARLIRHAGAIILRLPPNYQLLTEVLTHLRACRHHPHQAHPR